MTYTTADGLKEYPRILLLLDNSYSEYINKMAKFTLYGSGSSPNPYKAALVLKELGLDYETEILDISTGIQKQPAFTKHNPNGRVPVLIDHGNNDFAIWESSAIMCYLTEKYDTKHSVSVPHSGNEYAEMLQWLFFQASGHGIILGQISWFGRFHQEKLPSAIARYQNEAKRVLGVLEDVLKNKEWLVAGKCTIADLSFVPWNNVLGFLFGMEGHASLDLAKEFPRVNAWHQRMVSRPAVKAVMEEREKFVSSKR